MKKNSFILCFAIAMVASVCGCGLNAIPEDDAIEVSFQANSVSEEEKEKQYEALLVETCAEAVRTLEGIEDVSIQLDAQDVFKLKVQIEYVENADKKVLQERIEKSLKDFFSDRGDVIVEFAESNIE